LTDGGRECCEVAERGARSRLQFGVRRDRAICGVAGIILQRGQADALDPAAITRRMADLMAHRGPDDAGVWVSPDGRVALSHRRLAAWIPRDRLARYLDRMARDFSAYRVWSLLVLEFWLRTHRHSVGATLDTAIAFSTPIAGRAANRFVRLLACGRRMVARFT
jgi:hypothetical protein